MLYQLYNREDQRAHCFNGPVYCPLPMSPLVNPDLLNVLPELANPRVEAQAREATGFFFLGKKVPKDQHSWVGFTSWRQVQKGIGFRFKSEEEVDDLLKRAPVLAWNVMGQAQTVWTQGEMCHPGLLDYFERVHQRTPRVVTADGIQCYRTRSMRFFPWASYVLMSWVLFHEFIDDLTPEWEYMVANHTTDPYLTTMSYSPRPYVGSHFGAKGGHSAAWSAFFERYIGVWITQKKLRLLGLHNTGRPKWEETWKFWDEMS